MPTPSNARLSPAQQRAFDYLTAGLKIGSILRPRTQILSEHLATLPQEIQTVDAPQLIATTEGFTGANIKRAVEDAKAIYAYDKSRRVELKPTTDYFLRAVEAVRENKAHYAAAEAQAAMRPKHPMAGFMHSFVTSQIASSGSGDDS